MEVINIEIKARCKDPQRIRGVLRKKGAVCHGTDHQRDTYFRAERGRLKLREGNIEKNLIFYQREDESGPKKSDCIIYRTGDNSALKSILGRALDILVVVEKKREIYYLDNIKIHIDQLDRLGDFVEIEARQEGRLTRDDLHRQCRELMGLFGIGTEHLVSRSYSDLLMKG